MIYGHGNEITLYNTDIIADFSSNICHESVVPSLLTKISQSFTNISNYPEPDAHCLKEKIERYHQLKKSSALVTNGSTEAFYLIALHFTNKHSLILIPSFSEYEDACRIHDHEIAFVNNDDFDFLIPKGIDLVWIGNPNNPDGKTFSKEAINKLCEMFPSVCFLIDEAYADLCYEFESCISLIEHFKNLIVIRSLTKSFSIPGLRLGYLIANNNLCTKLESLKMPWSVNSIAIEVGCYIIDRYHNLLPDIENVIIQSRNLQSTINEIPSLNIISSNCNFFLVKLQNRKSSDLKKYLIENGILIRDAHNFKGLDESWIRLAVQKTEYNNLLIKKLKLWLRL